VPGEVPLEIRPPTAAELPRVGALCVAAYATYAEPDAAGYVEVLRDAAGRAAAAELLVAVDGGDVLGTVTFVPDGGPLREIAAPEEAEFRMLAVDPAAQGRGVGLALMRWVVEEARRRGKHAVVCSSLADMRAAHRIYERLGFRRVPERDWSPLPGLDLLAFAVAL
jgi:ribosomal protein S18 acetylase RimI-like enzyme